MGAECVEDELALITAESLTLPFTFRAVDIACLQALLVPVLDAVTFLEVAPNCLKN
jgi:hypothetical protein